MELKKNDVRLRSTEEKAAFFTTRKDESWKVFSTGSLHRFLNNNLVAKLPGDPVFDKGEVETMERLMANKQLTIPMVFQAYQVRTLSGVARSPFNAFSMIDRTSDGYFKIKPRSVATSAQAVECENGICARVRDLSTGTATPSGDVQTGVVSKIVAAGSHVSNGVLSSVPPTIPLVERDALYVTKAFALGCQTIGKELLDLSPSETLNGNELAARYYHDMFKFSNDQKAGVVKMLESDLPPRRRHGVDDDYSLTFADYNEGRVVTMLAPNTIAELTNKQIDEAPSLCDTLASMHTRFMGIRGGSSYGTSAFLDESWDAIPVVPAQRVNMNYCYDLIHSGLVNSRRLVVNTKDSLIAEALCSQLPAGAVVIMQGGMTPKSRWRSILDAGGVISLPSVGREMVARFEEENRERFDSYFDISRDVLNSVAVPLMREQVVANREKKLIDAKKYSKWAIYVSYIAVTKANAGDITIVGSSADTKAALTVLEKEWAESQTRYYGISSFSHSNFNVLEMSSPEFGLDYHDLVRMICSYMSHSTQYVYTGASFWNFCLKHGYGKLNAEVIFRKKASLDVNARAILGMKLTKEEAQAVEASFAAVAASDKSLASSGNDVLKRSVLCVKCDSELDPGDMVEKDGKFYHSLCVVPIVKVDERVKVDPFSAF